MLVAGFSFLLFAVLVVNIGAQNWNPPWPQGPQQGFPGYRDPKAYQYAYEPIGNECPSTSGMTPWQRRGLLSGGNSNCKKWDDCKQWECCMRDPFQGNHVCVFRNQGPFGQYDQFNQYNPQFQGPYQGGFNGYPNNMGNMPYPRW